MSIEFFNLDSDIETADSRWKKLVDSETPEREKFPQDWKNKTLLQKLCIIRALRPDRTLYALTQFVEEKLGTKYVQSVSIDLAKTFEETSPSTPLFFILSPGVDPLKDVEKHGRLLGFSTDLGNFHNISLGQGQEVIAERELEVAAEQGQWVVLQNIHLVKSWLSSLEKLLEKLSENAHENFRVFISAEPAAVQAFHIIPQGILESSIKVRLKYSSKSF